MVENFASCEEVLNAIVVSIEEGLISGIVRRDQDDYMTMLFSFFVAEVAKCQSQSKYGCLGCNTKITVKLL